MVDGQHHCWRTKGAVSRGGDRRGERRSDVRKIPFRVDSSLLLAVHDDANKQNPGITKRMLKMLV